MILMYCWVIVEPPCRSPPRAITQAARTMPRIEMPWSVQNVRFSAATTACLIVLGHLLEGQRLPVLDGEAAQLGLAVVVVDEGRRGLEVRVRGRAAWWWCSRTQRPPIAADHAQQESASPW